MGSKAIVIKNLKKKYKDNLVLNVDERRFELGEVYGLIGTNGSGKTTLLNLISGTIEASDGTIEKDHFHIEMIRHSNGLFQELSVYENIFMLREKKKRILFFSVYDWVSMKQQAANLLKSNDLDIDIYTKIKDLSLSEQKLLEVAISIDKKPDLLIVDEPLTFLDIHQVAQLNKMIDAYMSPEKMVIYASHRWDALFDVVTKVAIMREGAIVDVKDASQESVRGLLEFAEKDIHKYPKRYLPIWPGLLEVKGLRTRHLKQIDFELGKGEILGLVGLKREYKSEIGQALFGALNYEGHIKVEGSEKRIKTTSQAVEAGICYIGNGDESIFVEESVMNNVVSANVPRIRHLSRGAKRLISKYYLDLLNMTGSDFDNNIGTLSAGNKQKVVLAKWFFSKSKIFVFSKPTANIDAASKVDIYNIFADLAESGAGILVISNDLEEVAGICDRVMVIKDGQVGQIVERNQLSVHTLVEAMQQW